MTRKSYLSGTKDSLLPQYDKKNSYLTNTEIQTDNEIYAILPEEYDIFTKIKAISLDKSDVQQGFIGKCLNEIHSQLLKYYLRFGVRNVLPKLVYDVDEERTVNLSWSYFNYRVFLSFEPGVAEAICGIILKKENDEVTTEVKKLTESNYHFVIGKIIQMMINN